MSQSRFHLDMTNATPSFARALRLAREAKGLAQEDFDQVSSRTYVSALERGVKQPTVPKVGQLAGVLGIHPLTLLALGYVEQPQDAIDLLDQVREELEDLLAGAKLA